MPPVVPAKIRVPAPAALPRERLESRLREALRRRLTLVVAPAGSGKTTLVARLAGTCGMPVGWYRAETWDADERSFIRHVEAALLAAVPGLPAGWAGVEDAARNLEARSESGPVLLVIDDFHTLEDTEAESAFGRLVDYAPPWLVIVVASRVVPRVNLTRLRVAGELLELGPDDLRFRAWEVEELFRDIYHDPVPPGDLAVLARRTEGWAAGLQLYHLATRGKSVEERRRVLTGAGSSVRLVREYLASNVLSGLPDELRRFLLDTCVLGRLSGRLCDELRGEHGSAAILEDLAHRGVFTVPVEDADDAYRYHEVLRQHLDRMLVEEIGEAEARARHAAAGRLLETDGALSEALLAYCRAEDWDALRRLLGMQGERLAATSERAWVEVVPPAIERHDPWVALAAARRARNAGRWTPALDAYARAASAFGAAPAADIARRERRALAGWLDQTATQPTTAVGLLRGGLIREPAAAARDASRLDDRETPVVRGLLALAAGDVLTARRQLESTADAGEAGPIACAAARLAAAVAGVLGGEPVDPRTVDRAVDEAERAGVPWLARLAREIGVRLGAEPDDAADGARRASAPGLADDEWGPALLALADAWTGGADPEDRLASADAAAAAFRRVGAAVLEAWSRGLAAIALAQSGAPDARDVALSAESLGRATGTPAARLLAYAALADLDDDRGGEFAALAASVATETGLEVPGSMPVPPDDVAARPGPAGSQGIVRLHTFGGFILELDGRRVPLDGAKPRVRALLRLLAARGGAPVHREVIQDALWPEADAAAGARSLHVAVSALRRLLDDVAAPIGGRLVARQGDAYRLDLSPDDVDTGRFERAIADGRAARARGEGASAAFESALELYAGELLPEDGPADWVIHDRERYRNEALEAAQAIAEEALLDGDFSVAVRACRFGIGLDRYQDSLWRVLIEARDRAGDAGAAARDRRDYAQVLEGLGVTIPDQAPVSPN